MMGELHIEMAFLSVLGDWFTESGRDTVLRMSNTYNLERIDELLRGYNQESGTQHRIIDGAQLVKKLDPNKASVLCKTLYAYAQKVVCKEILRDV